MKVKIADFSQEKTFFDEKMCVRTRKFNIFVAHARWRGCVLCEKVN